MLSRELGRGEWGESVPWNQITTFSAEGLPSQYAFVPSERVTSLGVKPRSLANAGYATSRSTPICLYGSIQPIVLLGFIERHGSSHW